MKDKIKQIVLNNSVNVDIDKDLIYGQDFEKLIEDLYDLFALHIVVRQSEQLFCEKVIHHTCKWFDQYNGCMGCLVKKYEAK